MPDLLESLSKIQINPDIYKILPEGPGIYVFSTNKTPIYIGKAINLKRRVSSYFDLDLAPKTQKMVSSANFLSFIRVESELESLLLEARLIRKYMPKYNVISKDDKHPLYILITREKFPRVITVRKRDLNKVPNLVFFGPFPSSKNVYLILRLIRKIFPYSDHIVGSGKLGIRPCLYSHIGLCNPCPNEIKTNKDCRIYLKNIRNIKATLSGKFEGVKRSLTKEMKVMSKQQRFEEAGEIKNKVRNLAYITKPQMPTDFYIENPNLYQDQRKLEIESLKKILVNYLSSTRNKLKIENLQRIECFDIAHLAGTNATASMVVFIDGEAEKSKYRHFKVRQEKGQSDYASMAEIAKRRSKHFTDWGKPDLIIVDGGLGQVKTFDTAIHIGVSDISVVGVAKHPDHLVFLDGTKIKLEGKVLNLIQRIRDEAHRFARRYHHHLISKEYQNANNT